MVPGAYHLGVFFLAASVLCEMLLLSIAGFRCSEILKGKR